MNCDKQTKNAWREGIASFSESFGKLLPYIILVMLNGTATESLQVEMVQDHYLGMPVVSTMGIPPKSRSC